MQMNKTRFMVLALVFPRTLGGAAYVARMPFRPKLSAVQSLRAQANSQKSLASGRRRADNAENTTFPVGGGCCLPSPVANRGSACGRAVRKIV
jgi:hypothetical protein